ncbi:MAG: DUF111 family protein [Candidatus Omnitrophica bacterium]|nr:DUF111 family protein [Candidatus Omnitrophota bacterium]
MATRISHHHRILFVECSAGVSGDMLLAGFLSMGFPLTQLRRLIRQLGLDSVRIRVESVRRDSVTAARISIRGNPASFPRRAVDLIRFVEESSLSSPVKRSLIRVLSVLTRAEAKAHGASWRQVQFHQLGRVDTLVNLAGLCAGLNYFSIGPVYASRIPLGCRFHDPHGNWQARPGPSTQWLLRRFKTVRRPEPFEWSTPTGAAFLSAFACPDPAPPFKVSRVGHAVGHGRPPTGPSVLRLLVGRPILGLT